MTGPLGPVGDVDRARLRRRRRRSARSRGRRTGPSPSGLTRHSRPPASPTLPAAASGGAGVEASMGDRGESARVLLVERVGAQPRDRLLVGDVDRAAADAMARGEAPFSSSSMRCPCRRPASRRDRAGRRRRSSRPRPRSWCGRSAPTGVSARAGGASPVVVSGVVVSTVSVSSPVALLVGGGSRLAAVVGGSALVVGGASTGGATPRPTWPAARLHWRPCRRPRCSAAAVSSRRRRRRRRSTRAKPPIAGDRERDHARPTIDEPAARPAALARRDAAAPAASASSAGWSARWWRPRHPRRDVGRRQDRHVGQGRRHRDGLAAASAGGAAAAAAGASGARHHGRLVGLEAVAVAPCRVRRRGCRRAAARRHAPLPRGPGAARHGVARVDGDERPSARAARRARRRPRRRAATAAAPPARPRHGMARIDGDEARRRARRRGCRLGRGGRRRGGGGRQGLRGGAGRGGGARLPPRVDRDEAGRVADRRRTAPPRCSGGVSAVMLSNCAGRQRLRRVGVGRAHEQPRLAAPARRRAGR